MHAPSQRPWQQQAAQRLMVFWPAKAACTCGFMVVFFCAYFWVLDHPLRPPTVMPTLALDAWVRLSPWAFPVYVSLWFYVSLVPALLAERRTLARYALWMAAMCGASLLVFWLWPTATPQTLTDWSAAPGLSLIKGVDAPGNACPSLHVASAVFSACWLHGILRRIGAPGVLVLANGLYCVAIAWSTLATHQHVLLDVLAGALVGLLFAWASLRPGRRPKMLLK